MQTPPIPLGDLSALLRKAQDAPDTLTEAERDQLGEALGGLGPAITRANEAVQDGIDAALEGLIDSLSATLAARRSTRPRPTCDLGVTRAGVDGPCQLSPDHDGPCDPRA